MLLWMLKRPDASIEFMQRALLLCTSSLIPTLFPFMVISEIMVRSGCGTLFARFPGKLFSRIFGISPNAATALIFGILCGFPVGANKPDEPSDEPSEDPSETSSEEPEDSSEEPAAPFEDESSAPAASAPAESSAATDDQGGSALLIVLIVAVVAVITAVVIIVIKRKK